MHAHDDMQAHHQAHGHHHDPTPAHEHMDMHAHEHDHAPETFPTDTAGLPEAVAPAVVRLKDGETYDLHIGPVRKHLDGAEVRMLAYNGSIPGPALRVDQGSTVTVQTVNEGDIDTTVHWHGLRLENRYDGVPHDTQAPIGIGGAFTYRVQFPDAGIYWYHPHLREDFAQEMGLYGTIVVAPSDPGYWPAVDRELTLTLDDVLIEDGRMAPFRHSGPTHTAMGRFGNVMLINGETRFAGEAAVGEVVRLYLVNTANTRLFNIAVRGARMKLVGGDSGRYERETFVDAVLLSPSERAVVDVLFETPGEARLEHRTPERVYDLGAFTVAGEATGTAATAFAALRTDPELTAERARIEADHDLHRAPDKTLAFIAEMPLLYGQEMPEASSYVCPMHPEITSAEPGTCPICGMRLVPVAAPTSYVCPMHPEVTSDTPGTCPICGMKLVPSTATAPAHDHGHMAHDMSGHEPMDMEMANGEHKQDAPAHDHHAMDHGEHAHGHGQGDGLEWEDLMPEINRASDTTNMVWKLIDRDTGAVNHAITWAFTVGDRVKIRLVNEMDSDHPMHHPFHVHGAGRFLILARDDQPEENLVWKDTVLLRAGETVDILLDVTNPGRWMAHCHIAEHTESGMMFSFDVAPAKHNR